MELSRAAPLPMGHASPAIDELSGIPEATPRVVAAYQDPKQRKGRERKGPKK